MNIQQLSIGEYLVAEYHEFNEKENNYNDKIIFNYKTYDDTQYRESRNQIQSGNLSSKFSLSIKTTANLPFKTKDRIRLFKDERAYQITGVQVLHNSVNALSNSLFPHRKGNNPILIHLNKDDV